MIKDEIIARVQEIADSSYDDEVAHSKEDKLRYDFICFVSRQGGELAELADEVLKTEKMNFARWCA